VVYNWKVIPPISSIMYFQLVSQCPMHTCRETKLCAERQSAGRSKDSSGSSTAGREETFFLSVVLFSLPSSDVSPHRHVK